MTRVWTEAQYSSRYLSIDPEQYSYYNDMECFIWCLENDGLANQLENAIGGGGAFRRFKDILTRHPCVQEAWYDFQACRMETRMRRWVECMDIDPVEWGQFAARCRGVIRKTMI